MVFWEAREPALILRHRAHHKWLGKNKPDRYNPKFLPEQKIPRISINGMEQQACLAVFPEFRHVASFIGFYFLPDKVF